MTPQLVATDLDGTLLQDDGSIAPRTREVLSRLDERGVPVVFVTARPLRWMTDLWSAVGRHGVAIVSNGAIVYDVAAGEVSELEGIEREAGLALVAAIRAGVPGASFAIELLSGIARDEAFIERYRVPPGSPVGPLDELWTEPAVKLLVRAEGSDPVALREAVAAAVGAQATPTWSVDGLVEISAAGVTKAAALARVADRLGVAAADVLAFGDMPNDLPMLEWAGTSYAMADGHPSVVAAADHIAPPHDQDGVASVLSGIFDV